MTQDNALTYLHRGMEFRESYWRSLLPNSEYRHPDGRGMLAPYSLVTGHLIDLAEPDFEHMSREKLIRAIACGLARTARYGGQTDVHYSVARHCLLGLQLVPGILALLSQNDLQALQTEARHWANRCVSGPVGMSTQDQNINFIRDLTRLHFLLHDASEGLGLGDVPSPLKRLIAPLYEPLEERMMAAIYDALGIEPPGPCVAAVVKSTDVQMLHEEMWHLRGHENHRAYATHDWHVSDAGWVFKLGENDDAIVRTEDQWVAEFEYLYRAVTNRGFRETKP